LLLLFLGCYCYCYFWVVIAIVNGEVLAPCPQHPHTKGLKIYYTIYKHVALAKQSVQQKVYQNCWVLLTLLVPWLSRWMIGGID